MKHKVRHIHFIGIGGVGMSGIAEILQNFGYIISGSDMARNSNTDRLVTLGITVFIGHADSNIDGSDVVVTSSAITHANPELQASKRIGKIIVPRAVMLAELMRFEYGIAIAGTHGKTTTTSLCAETLFHCGLDPTFIIGGKLAVSNSNAKLGLGEYLVAEADESDASFLYLNPLIAVVTNIDLDHMETYDHDETKLKQAFIDFLHRLPFYGRAILCNDDKRVQEIIPALHCQITTYGLTADSDIYASKIHATENQIHFTLCIKENNIALPVSLNLHGVHNVLNALAVIAVALECEAKLEDVLVGLANFHGVGRRCQHYPNIIFNNYEALLIDDYAHHPNEIRATVAALRLAYPQKRFILIFQPHRYTRTRDLFDDFVQVIQNVEQIIIIDVYPAGEKKIPQADGRALVQAIRRLNPNVTFANTILDVKQILDNIIQDNDVVITMGAGDIGKLPQILTSA